MKTMTMFVILFIGGFFGGWFSETLRVNQLEEAHIESRQDLNNRTYMIYQYDKGAYRDGKFYIDTPANAFEFCTMRGEKTLIHKYVGITIEFECKNNP